VGAKHGKAVETLKQMILEQQKWHEAYGINEDNIILSHVFWPVLCLL
jgi:hypothetical protein